MKALYHSAINGAATWRQANSSVIQGVNLLNF